MDDSSLWDSVSSTKTMHHLRSTSSATWRVGIALFVGCLAWALLEPRSLIEARLPGDGRWWLEAHRMWLGPALFVPVAVLGIRAWIVHWRSPTLPGRPTLVALLVLGWACLCVLAPLQAIDRQKKMTEQARQELLPMARRARLFNQPLPAVDAGWHGLPQVRAVEATGLVAVVDLPWLPGGGLGIDREGKVSPLGRPASGNPPR